MCYGRWIQRVAHLAKIFSFRQERKLWLLIWSEQRVCYDWIEKNANVSGTWCISAKLNCCGWFFTEIYVVIGIFTPFTPQPSCQASRASFRRYLQPLGRRVDSGRSLDVRQITVSDLDKLSLDLSVALVARA